MATLSIAVQGKRPGQMSWIEVDESDDYQDIVSRAARCLHFVEGDSVADIVYILEDVDYKSIGGDLEILSIDIVDLAQCDEAGALATIAAWRAKAKE